MRRDGFAGFDEEDFEVGEFGVEAGGEGAAGYAAADDDDIGLGGGGHFGRGGGWVGLGPGRLK